MKLVLIIGVLLFPAVSWGQSANFEDDFSDGDFTANPEWAGDTDKFLIFDLNDNNVIRLNDENADGNSSASLYTPSTNTVGYWEFFVRIDGNTPSSSNKVEVFLMSNISDLDEAVNGYAVRVGETGDDVFRIVRFDNGSEEEIILSDTTIIQSSSSYRVKVTRDAGGEWALEVGKGYDGILMNSGNTAIDNTYSATNFFGFRVSYTSTRSNDYYLDFKIDIKPVEVSSVSAINSSEIDMTFSKEIDFTTAKNNDFLLNPGNYTPQDISLQGPETIRLTFADAISGGENELSISGIEDAANESTLADTTVPFIVYDEFQPGDVVINEFLKDPPDGAAEYVELKNTSDKFLNLKDWEFGDNSNISTISETVLSLLPESYIVLTTDTVALNNFFGEGNYIEVSPWRALNNGSDQVRLFQSGGNLVDSLEYTSSWGGVKVAIERLDESVSSTYLENWGESPAADYGTPGFANQVEADITAPDIVDVLVQDEQNLLLVASERMEAVSAETAENYKLQANPESGAATPAIPTIETVNQIAPDTLLLTLNVPLQEFDGSWSVHASNLTDIFGNSADDAFSFNYFVIYPAKKGQVVINEFMYDPGGDLTEFIELYNHSDSTFNLQNWTLNDNTGNRRSISSVSYNLPSGKYVVLAPDSTLTELFPGIPVIIMSSRFPALNNNTDAIVIRNQNENVIDSLTYFSSWGGDEVSLERRSTTISGNFAENWGDSPSINLATPASENQVDEDNAPPEINSYRLFGDKTLQLIFNERIKTGPATDLANFNISTEVAAKTAENDQYRLQYLEPDTILFTNKEGFSSSVSGNVYEIEILNQEDIFGNRNSVQHIQVEQIAVDTAQAGDVVINEFMYDPSAAYSEFIELSNFTGSNFNLQNWTLSDNTGNRRIITSQPYILQPNIPDMISGDVYVILAPDSTLYYLYPDRPIIVMGNSFPALNNGTDAIIIRNEKGVLIDSLTYSSTWGGSEISLERKMPDAPAVFSENWGDSPSPESGTPGLKNLIEADEIAPTILQIYALSADSILITFNERVDSISAVNLAHYSITPVNSVLDVGYLRDEVILKLANPLEDGNTYTITIQNLEDVFGNKRNVTSAELDFVAFSEAEENAVVINEILYRRANADAPEFIELFNTSNQNFNLSNWKLADAASEVSIPENSILKSGDYIVFTDQEEFAEEVDAIYIAGFPSLNDDEDAVVIKNINGMLIDSLYYQNTWGNNEQGVSLERKDPLAASNDAANWASSISESGNSLNAQSSVYEPDETAPEVIFAKLLPDNQILVAFSEFVEIQENDITVNSQPATIADFSEQNANILTLTGMDFTRGEKITVNLKSISDMKGNQRLDSSIEVAQPLQKSEIIINEILFDPLSNSDDNLPDQTEYIELFNRADYAVSLEGFFLHDEPDENAIVRTILPVTSQFKWIPSRSYVLVFSDNTASNFADSQLAKYFEAEEQEEPFTIHVDRSSLSLASSGDAIYIADSTGTVIDSVFYDENWHNPNMHSTKGISLERIDPDRPGDDENNWSSSTNISGGTPGYQNSIYQQAGAGPPSSGINFSPNPFSPDDDGFDDNLFINYKLDESDYLLRVRIFDRYGRLVRKLTDGEAAGFEGSLIWDGLTDDRRKNRVGIYIILFEAYNSARGKKLTFKETVVLARKF